MEVIFGNWLGQPQTITGKDSKQPIIRFWASKYLLVPSFATLEVFPGLHEERIVRVQGISSTGASTIGNAAPLHLLVLGFVLMQ
jgi:hypothetical protein